MTYLREGITNISPSDMSKALEKVRSTNVTPASTQILLRTIWTKVKEANTRRTLNHPTLGNDPCSNCETALERTMHLFYECPLAFDLWKRIFDTYNATMSQPYNYSEAFPVDLNMDRVIFHKFPDNLPKTASNDLNDLILMGKHTLYRFKFGVNSDRHPSLRLTMITLALDLESLTEVRKINGKTFPDMKKIIDELKRLVGL